MLRALTLLFLLNACGQLRSLTRADRLGPEEKLEYLILRTLDPQAGEQYLSLGSAQARQEYLDWFWQDRDPKERHRYYERAEKAAALFGRLDLLGDERIPVYIRYGPARREEYAPLPVENETLRLYVNPAEIWTYDSLGLQFDFVKTGVGFRQVGFTRFGNHWFPPAFEPVDYGRPAPSPGPDARKLDLQIALYRLSQHQDTVQVELHYGVRPAGLKPGDILRFEFRFDSRRYGSFVRSGWYGFSADSGIVLVVGRELFSLPADIYSVRVSAVNRDGSAVGEVRAELNLVDYVRRTQPGSDIVLYALVDDVFQSPQFEHPRYRRVIPLVVPEVRSGGTFYALFEIYNLKTDSLNRHRAQVRYELMDLDTRRMAVIPAPSRFITGAGTTGTALERVHTMDLNPGNYLLLARVEDLNSGRQLSLTTRFRILPPEKK
ncbi:MAG: hypothetical protein ABIK54_04435 [candidate division WOR-3 bacterium]